MNILILTQYFPPETGAPQNRLYDLALKLRNKGARVSILTAFPNYPYYEIFSGFKGKVFSREEMNGLLVYRSWIFVSKSKSILFRLLNYFSFTFSSLFLALIKVEKQDIIICESPPLFLGFTAVLLKYFKKSKLVFNVSDLWPESAVKLGIVQNRFLIKLSEGLENWIYRNSDYITGQTQGIVSNIHQRFPDKPILWLPNGVDVNELQSRLTGLDWRSKNGFKEDDLLFYFGGLLGYAQGLDCVIQAATFVKDLPQVKFILIGEGPEKERLIKLKDSLDAKNVFFFSGVPKGQIADVIQSIDVGIIPLKKLDLFLGAIPSKIFEILCLKKPILLGIDGEAKDLFIDTAEAGLAFEPERADSLAKQVRYVHAHPEQIPKWGLNGYSYVTANFNRVTIADSFYSFIK
jgi:glycosyltransferase involved in cell wall biosynthesis